MENQHQYNNNRKVAEPERIETNHLGFAKSLRNFYNELIQNTSLLTNYNFTATFTKINKKIKIYTQQRYPITYVNKGKRKLQTSTITPQRVQPSTWKKTRLKLPTNPSYYYTPRSGINISLAGMSTSNAKTPLA
ncbi:hypothetical protein G9A89_023562 [Geosiphon pyriformis]|nr:hypothetical protein G9A89_023562 [Geosiphon pyriformis]